MVKVYRLEKDGYGPFCPFNKKDIINVPFPHIKSLLDLPKEPVFKKGDNMFQFLYGCTSLEQLHDYFQTTLDVFLSMGFEIKEYNVSAKKLRYALDSSQVAFQYTNESVYVGNGQYL